jgi:hypothetical protein
MGKYIDRAREAGIIGKRVGIDAGRKMNNFAEKQVNNKQGFSNGKIREKPQEFIGENPDNIEDDYLEDDEGYSGKNDYDDDVNIRIAQKPESFHHFILENKYKDLERNIRGYKDVFDKEKQEWIVKRKDRHCFTDEESEDILRTAQSHLATDIKLTFYSKETFGLRFLAIYNEVEFLFKRIMEYRFGRFGDSKNQGEMKEQAVKIFVELITRIEANYLMAIAGMENKRTHDAVHSQESLQGAGDDYRDTGRSFR